MSIAVDVIESQGTISGRALKLLGSGVPQESVASALGVTASYISQLLSDENFAEKVTSLKYSALAKHTHRDEAYDSLEDKLLEKMSKALPLMMRPMDIQRALKTVNEAKRRGQDSKESIIAQQNIVEITMPTQIIQQFTTNINNQVVKTGELDLITIQSGDLLKSVDPSHIEELPEAEIIPELGAPEEPEILSNNTLLNSL